MRTQLYDELTGSRIPPNARRWKGGNTTTSTTSVPPAGESEANIYKSISNISGLQEQMFPLLIAYQFPELALSGQLQGLELDPALKTKLESMASSNKTNQEISDLTAQQIKRYLAGENMVTPEQEANINTIYGNERTLGQQEIEKYARSLAASRGMNMGDTPISAEALRSKQNLELGLGTAKASSMLNFGNSMNAFSQARQGFQNAMDQSSSQNRLNLAAYQPASMGLASLMSQQRGQYPTTTTTGPSSNTFQQMGGLGGIGSLMTGAANLGGLASNSNWFSSLF